MSEHLPIRFVATTFNLWKDRRWPEREESMRAYVRTARPDILCLQEIRPFTRALLDEELPGHSRVDDPFYGWTGESNIYWNAELFEYVEHGTERIKIDEPEILSKRHLFWVRLRVTGRDRTLFVGTAHYAPPGMERERVEGLNPRLHEARETLAHLDRLVPKDEPCLFMGDLNESANAIKILRAGGLTDSFKALGLVPRPTHPSYPTVATETGVSPHRLDWQFHRGPLRVMNTSVADFFYSDMAPSDHKPVVTTYAME